MTLSESWVLVFLSRVRSFSDMHQEVVAFFGNKLSIRKCRNLRHVGVGPWLGTTKNASRKKRVTQLTLYRCKKQWQENFFIINKFSLVHFFLYVNINGKGRRQNEHPYFCWWIEHHDYVIEGGDELRVSVEEKHFFSPSKKRKKRIDSTFESNSL